jgi:alpha-ribazole phosphatase
MPPVAMDLWCWRHPRAQGAAGRCIGITDLPVEPRKARRLAQRIRATVRREGLLRVVWVSPLARSRAVGRWLVRWGFACRVDARLAEIDFGGWDGRAWGAVPWAEVQAWEADLRHHAPGGGESLAQLQARVRAFVAERQAAGDRAVLLVGHGGWITALVHPPVAAGRLDAAHWPAPPRHGALVRHAVAVHPPAADAVHPR